MSVEEAERQIADLRRALSHQRELTEAERRRAELAERSRDLAWRLAACPGALTPDAGKAKLSRGS